MESKISNNNKIVPCDIPDCGRKDRPLYVWRGKTGSLLICDVCNETVLAGVYKKIFQQLRAKKKRT